MSFIEKSQQLRELATEVRNNVLAREAIAKGFELIACVISPCEDCGSIQEAAVINLADHPETRADVGTVAAGVIAATKQVLADDQPEQGGNVNAGV